MIVRYDNGNKVVYVDLDKVEYMELYRQTIDSDPGLKLVIKFLSGSSINIVEVVRHVQKDTGEIIISEYPLDKLKKLVNSFFKYKRGITKKTRITKTSKDGTTTEEIEETIDSNKN